MEENVLCLMESCFGRDLRAVRIHTGRAAAKAATFIGAAAFTIGENIYFANGFYSSDSREGRWLLAHELAHVIQQTAVENGRPGSTASLENLASLAADAIADGQALAPGFSFGKAMAGTVQCHLGPPCRGISVSAGAREVWMEANALIEGAYLATPGSGGPTWVIFGSQFETGRDIAPPIGFSNKRFAEFLLKNLRGIRNQRRPDIIDFKNRVFYEIKTVGYVRDGEEQIQSYYRVTETVRMTEYPSEPPWVREYATWYPPHELPMSANRIVCTQATNHTAHPALILYDVRQLGQDEEEKKVQSMVVDQTVTEYDTTFNEMKEALKVQMRHKIEKFDPENPDYIIIVPKRFYMEWYDRKWDKMLSPGIPPFLNPKTTVGAFHRIGWIMVGMTAAAYASFMIGVFALDMIGSAGLAAAEVEIGAAGAAGGAEVIELAAFRAVATSEAVKQIGRAAGVLFVVGVAGKASGAEPSGAPEIKDVSAVRAIPISSLRTQGTSIVGFSKDFGFSTSMYDLSNPSTSIPASVRLGSVVTYNGQPHVVIAKMKAR